MKLKKLEKKRRQEGKTNYTRRLILLKSEKPRLVIRKTNKYIILQIVETEGAQDKIISSITTKELLKHGWPENKKGCLKSLSASYLAGLLLGKLTKLNEEIILDIGLIPSTKASRIYAAVKGISDSGIKIKFNEKILPELEKIEGNGKLDSEEFNKIKQEIENVK